MTTVHKTAQINADPRKVWGRIADVGKVHDILPSVVECRLDGDKRLCTFADGGQLTERIISVDAELMRLAYSITDSPFPLEYHAASMRVVPEANGCRLEWTTDLKPDALKESLAPLFDQLFEQLTARVGAQ
ncbi:SRPBCC family protein [Piscinibacter sp. HJYY11]|uniref:SRPBCC family protein n=1 Tax=Piscinibacter sp. HJYY11 TaxID=2801333 RepID=UPI00191D3D3C|nr:SRPBCC family protein [Piscinibacter sp. HJYY11]MBL0726611.1 SRPBCC family protein [Piscinibacter sp. HJYY11]